MTVNNPEIVQRQVPRKDMLMLAILMRPGQDFTLLGSWDNPQILMDLSKDELAYGQAAIDALRPAIDALTEQQLTELLSRKMTLMGDELSRIFNLG